MNNYIIQILLILVIADSGLAMGSLSAQQGRQITLSEAQAEARTNSRSALAARSRAEAARLGERAEAAARWPTVVLDAGAVRSNDPVAAFGGRLRQGRFRQADFDPERLNHPDPLTDWSAGVGALWAPLDLSRGAALEASREESAGAELEARWAKHSAEFQAEVRFLEALAAEQRLGASEVALDAAQANLARTSRRVEQGLLTDVDELQARAALEQARAQSIEADRSVAEARDLLALVMGWEPGLVPIPVGDELTRTPVVVSDGDVFGRDDLNAAERAVRGAEARVRQIGRTRWPRLEGFARMETHSSEVFSGAEADWTVGFQVSLPVFTGFEVSARKSGATAMARAARLEHAEQVAAASTALRGAIRRANAAERQALAAAAAEAAAAEAARLMRRRFEEGLTTTADLLSAEASAADLAAHAILARLGLHIAAAQVAYLTGTDNNNDLTEGIDR
jgi:outer membrane protein TolC